MYRPIKCCTFAVMKKGFILLFALCYLYSSSGISINLHYCGGKIKSVSLFQTDEEACCKGKMKKAGCCKDKNAFVKIEDSQASASSLQIPGSKSIQSVFIGQVHRVALNELLSAEFIPLSHAPPNPDSAPPSYLKNRVFRI